MTNYHRKKEPVQNRQQILDAAMQLTSEVGLDSLTLDIVAKRANLSKGGLLHHFPKKDALIDELFESGLQHLSDGIRRRQQDGLSAAMAYFELTINEDLDEQQKLYMKVLIQAMIQNPSYRERLQKWYQQSLGLDDLKPFELAAVLVANGFWHSNVIGMFTLTDEQKTQIKYLFSGNLK